MIREIKNKLDIIQKKPQSRWTVEEHEFYKRATDRLMRDLLAKAP